MLRSKRGRVGVKQCMHSFHFLDSLLSVFFDDCMSKLFRFFIVYSKFCLFLILQNTKLFLQTEITSFLSSRIPKWIVSILTKLCRNPVYYLSVSNIFRSSVSFEYILWLKDLMWFLYIASLKMWCCHA